MPEIRIDPATNLGDLERILKDAATIEERPFHIRLARKRKQHFFKDVALSNFFGTLQRMGSYVLKDSATDWDVVQIDHHYGQNLGGLSGYFYAQQLESNLRVVCPVTVDQLAADISLRAGLLKRQGIDQSALRDLSFLALDPEHREPLALAGLVNNRQRFVSALLDYKQKLLDRSVDDHPDLFGAGPTAQNFLAEFVFELYQNGAQHGNRDRENRLLHGIRSISIRRHNPGSMKDLPGFAQGFPELETYIHDWTSLNRGTAFYEVAICDNGMGILERFVATRPEFAPEMAERGRKLALLRRILLTPSPTEGGGGDLRYPAAYSSKDVSGVERGAGRGLERALKAVAALNGFVSLRTDEFWLYKSFPKSSVLDDVGMNEVAGESFAKVNGTCFTALFPVNLRQ